VGVIVGQIPIVASRGKALFSFLFFSFPFASFSSFSLFVLHGIAGRLVKVGVHAGLG